MEGQYRWMEESLQRTSEQAREVLERARRREVDWWAVHTHRVSGARTVHGATEDNGDLVTLEEAFRTMANFMRHTTEQCKEYHRCVPSRRMTEQEKQHIGRFHRRGSTHMLKTHPSSSSLLPPPQSIVKRSDPRDVHIEVSPGTYSISAGSPHCQAQTRVVNITPGQSLDLTFHV